MLYVSTVTQKQPVPVRINRMVILHENFEDNAKNSLWEPSSDPFPLEVRIFLIYGCEWKHTFSMSRKTCILENMNS